MTAFALAMDQVLAQLTGQARATVTAAMDAWIAPPAGVAPVVPTFTLAGTSPAVPVYLERVAALTRDDAPAVIVMPLQAAFRLVTDAGADPGETGLSQADFRFAVMTYVRGDPAGRRADPLFAAAHARLMADVGLGGLATRLDIKSLDIRRDPADGTVGWLTATYSAGLAVDETTLENRAD